MNVFRLINEPSYLRRKKMQDVVGQIMAFENGELDNSEVFALFQFLLDSGMIHSLQGSYQRMAEDLLLAGKIEMPRRD